jgi:GLPGLI family protein
MKKIWIGCLAIAFAGQTQAQQTEGRVVYERTTEMQVMLAGMPEEMQRMVPRTRTDKMEVLFSKNQSLRRTLPPEESDEQVFNSTTGGGGSMQIRMMAAGADDITFTDLGKGVYVDQREFATKKYLIADTVRKLSWKLTGETKTILGYTCQQAIAQRLGTRPQTSMVNGEIKREQVADTANITAWFAPTIPVAAGPEVPGQLPGLILAMDINNGRTVYKAVEISPKVDVAVIKEPKSGKKVTPEEFAQERDKMMKEMQQNGRRGATIRMAN